MIREQFDGVMADLCRDIAGENLDKSLETKLNSICSPDSDRFAEIERLCQAGIAEGWMCAQGEPPRRWGRVIDPGVKTHGFSVDVVAIDDTHGPHHRHPTGEICAVMPLDEGATFDRNAKGWCVYGAETAHWPTVRGGSALVLYLLPDGEIEFTGKAPPSA